jgi:dephospho-CoA kinase
MNYNIGVIGKLGSGKTTAANFIIDNYGYIRLSLATPIKEIMKEYLDIKDKTDPRYRKVAQTIGTDWFRSIDDKVWVKHLMKRAGRLKNKSVVCDDVRFLNEAETLLGNRWVLIYLDCPLEIRKARCIDRDGTFDDATVNHPSETGVDDIMKQFGNDPFLITVDASGTVENTNNGLRAALAKLGIRPLPDWFIKLKKGDLKNWLSKTGGQKLHSMKTKLRQFVSSR